MTSATLFPLETQAPPAFPAARGDPPAGRGADPLAPRTPASGRGAVRTALTRREGASSHGIDWFADPYLGRWGGFDAVPAVGSVRAPRREPGHGESGDPGEAVLAKDGFVAALRRDLRTRVRPGEHLAIGSVTEPYPAVERDRCVVRESLAVLARESGLRISVTTRSNLVLRDAGLLREIARRNDLRVSVAIATPDRRLGRLLEPGAPPPALRIATLRALRRNGLPAGVLLTPVLPGVTDAEVDLVALLRAAGDAGARFAGHQTVLVEGAARARLVSLLRRGYPRVAARFEVWTRARGPDPRDVRTEVARRIDAVASALGLGGASSRAAGPAVPSRPDPFLQRVFRFAGGEA